MDLDIPGIKDCMIQEVLIWKLLISNEELGVDGIDEGRHVITTMHVLRKHEISISYTNVKKLLCPCIGFRILAKTHVLMKIVNGHVEPKIGVGESSWYNLLS